VDLSLVAGHDVDVSEWLDGADDEVSRRGPADLHIDEIDPAPNPRIDVDATFN